MALRETLELDVGRALAGVSRLGAAIDQATRPRSVSLTAQTGPLTQSVTSAIDAADESVTPTADTAALSASISGAIDAADSTTSVTADTAQLTSSVEGAIDAADSSLDVQVDASSVGEASEAVAGVGGELAEAGVQAGGLTAAFGGMKGAIGGLGAAAAATGLTAFLVSAANAGSDLEESINKAKVIFEEAAGTITDFAKQAPTAVGLSGQAAIEAAGSFGSLFRITGESAQGAADMSIEMVKLAADLASINNIPVDEALMRLQAGLVGETEPLRRVQVLLNEQSVAAKAAELGLVGLDGTVSEQAKVQARYALILEQTTRQQGDFQNTSDGVANRTRIVKAQFEDLMATIGVKLLPVVQQLLGALQQLIGGADHIMRVFDRRGLQGVLEEFAPALAGVPGAISNTVNAIRTAIEAVVQAVEVPIEGLVGFFQERGSKIAEAFSNVVAIVKVVLTPLIVFFVGLFMAMKAAWQLFGDEILNIVRAAWTQIQSVIRGALQIIRGIIDLVLGILTLDWTTAWNGIKSIVQGVWTIISGLVQFGITLLQNLISMGMSLIGAVWSAAWNAIVSFVRAAISQVVATILALPGQIIGLVGTLLGVGVQIMGGLWNGLLQGWATVLGWIQGIPGEIVGFFANAGDYLLDIGAEIMNGLWEGLKGVWEEILGWAGGLVDQLKSVKGPLDEDRRALIPHGRALMGGLEEGLRYGESRVLALGAAVAGMIGSAFSVAPGMVSGRPAPTGGGGGATITHRREATTVVVVDPAGLRSALPGDVAAEVEEFLLGRARSS